MDKDAIREQARADAQKAFVSIVHGGKQPYWYKVYLHEYNNKLLELERRYIAGINAEKYGGKDGSR